VRYVLLDRITLLAPPHRAEGVKCVSLSDDIFEDHFPGHPIMPGALLVEAMAQLGGVLVEACMRDRGRQDLHALLVMSDRARFRKVVRPGDKVNLVTTAIRVNEDGGRVNATAHVDGDLVSEAELTFAFASVTHPSLLARRRDVLNIWLYGSVAGDTSAPAT
jgi:3-hydroxyacyl-[acyl-carrier-protein] dehydratase